MSPIASCSWRRFTVKIGFWRCGKMNVQKSSRYWRMKAWIIAMTWRKGRYAERPLTKLAHTNSPHHLQRWPLFLPVWHGWLGHPAALRRLALELFIFIVTGVVLYVVQTRHSVPSAHPSPGSRNCRNVWPGYFTESHKTSCSWRVWKSPLRYGRSGGWSAHPTMAPRIPRDSERLETGASCDGNAVTTESQREKDIFREVLYCELHGFQQTCALWHHCRGGMMRVLSLK